MIGALGRQLWYYAYLPPSAITEFNYERDSQAILELFNQDWYWLVANKRDDYSPDFMLKHRASKQNMMHAGSMNIYVIRENNEFVGFTAYYMKAPSIGYLNFVAIKPELRGKGYAKQLVQYSVDDLLEKGAKRIDLITRPSNTAARKLYESMGFVQTNIDDTFVYFSYFKK